MDQNEKDALIDLEGVTLDGHPARVIGRKMGFAVVRCDGCDDHYTGFAWETVAHIAGRDRAFKSGRVETEIGLDEDELEATHTAIKNALARSRPGSPRGRLLDRIETKLARARGLL